MKVEAPSKNVYICTGKNAKIYHATSKCKGLNRYSGEIKAISFEVGKMIIPGRFLRLQGLLCYSVTLIDKRK